ncbi:MAG TPA: hypothetical protein DD417_16540 [Elusimicrobia bacterium]|nr:hypothetical protein [Elusimicrobiota bacterium]
MPEIFSRIYRALSRHVTILVIPHADFPLLRSRFSLGFVVFGLALWSGMTVWAGFIVGRHVDYWVTKADNVVIHAKMRYMVDEIGKSREVLETARATDQQMRILLGMKSRQDILKPDEGLGGPSVADRVGLGRLLSSGARLSQPDLRRRIRRLRLESEQRLASFQEIAWYITNKRNLLRSTPSIWPSGGRITSSFGYRFSPFSQRGGLHSGSMHEGIDIANKPDTPIVATADGVVRYAGWMSGFGMVVVIDHGFGYSTLYGHTSNVTVKIGARVVRGQMIAFMGTTGRSTGIHCHYEVWRHGKPVNPVLFLQERKEDLS